MTNKHLKIKPSNILRIIYATPLNVHKHETGLTLDLSYVTDRIIVCSYPVLRFPKLMYRNSLGSTQGPIRGKKNLDSANFLGNFSFCSIRIDR